MSVQSIYGEKYFVTFTDDFTHLTVTYLLKHKNEVFDRFKEFYAMACNHFGKKIERFRCDGGGEFILNEFKKFCKQKGIVIEYNAPYTSEQNGVAERLNRTIMDKARAMMFDAGVDKCLWSEAVMAATYVTNRSPTLELKSKTPFEMWFGRKPNISNLRIFGCDAYIHIPSKKRSKLDEHCDKMIMVGYDLNGYRVYDPISNQIKIVRHVTFNENFETQKEDVIICDDSHNNDAATSNDLDDLKLTCKSEPTHDDTSLNKSQDSENDLTEDEFITPDKTNVRRNPAREKKMPVRFDDFDLDNDIGSAFSAMNFVNDVPLSYKDVIGRPDQKQWEEAINEELKSLKANSTWSVVKKTDSMKVIGTQWIFKIKDEVNGPRFKARLVAKGYMQRHGIDFEETYAPVARLPTVRLVLAVGIQKQHIFRHLDISTAFLNGFLKEDVYIAAPNGIHVQPGYVLKLNRSLYGLKQSPKAWNDRFNQFITSLKFRKSDSDSCLYVRSSNGTLTYLVLYVDDILLSGSCSQTIDLITKRLQNEFELKDLGKLKQYMGMNIEIDEQSGVLTIDQSRYIEKLIAKFNMSNCKPASTPMEIGLKLSNGVKDKCTNFPYRELIGSLSYLAQGTRPDLSFALNYFSRFQEFPNEEHCKHLKRLLRFLRGTVDYKLVYKRNEDSTPLIGFVDADWANDVVDRKSTSGYLFKVFGNLVVWSSKKQPIVTLSSTEAEYVAACDASREALWLRKMFANLLIELNEPVILMEDNQGCIFMSQAPETRRTKHMDTKYKFLRECSMNGKILLRYIETNHQLADILTKPLQKTKFNEFSRGLGLHSGGVLEL